MYLLFQAGGYPAQAALWQMQKTGRLVLYDLHGDADNRLAALMEQYQDRHMVRIPLMPQGVEHCSKR